MPLTETLPDVSMGSWETWAQEGGGEGKGGVGEGGGSPRCGDGELVEQDFQFHILEGWIGVGDENPLHEFKSVVFHSQKISQTETGEPSYGGATKEADRWGGGEATRLIHQGVGIEKPGAAGGGGDAGAIAVGGGGAREGGEGEGVVAGAQGVKAGVASGGEGEGVAGSAAQNGCDRLQLMSNLDDIFIARNGQMSDVAQLFSELHKALMLCKSLLGPDCIQQVAACMRNKLLQPKTFLDPEMFSREEKEAACKIQVLLRLECQLLRSQAAPLPVLSNKRRGAAPRGADQAWQEGSTGGRGGAEKHKSDGLGKGPGGGGGAVGQRLREAMLEGARLVEGEGRGQEEEAAAWRVLLSQVRWLQSIYIMDCPHNDQLRYFESLWLLFGEGLPLSIKYIAQDYAYLGFPAHLRTPSTPPCQPKPPPPFRPTPQPSEPETGTRRGTLSEQVVRQLNSRQSRWGGGNTTAIHKMLPRSKKKLKKATRRSDKSMSVSTVQTPCIVNPESPAGSPCSAKGGQGRATRKIFRNCTRTPRPVSSLDCLQCAMFGPSPGGVSRVNEPTGGSEHTLSPHHPCTPRTTALRLNCPIAFESRRAWPLQGAAAGGGGAGGGGRGGGDAGGRATQGGGAGGGTPGGEGAGGGAPGSGGAGGGAPGRGGARERGPMSESPSEEEEECETGGGARSGGAGGGAPGGEGAEGRALVGVGTGGGAPGGGGAVWGSAAGGCAGIEGGYVLRQVFAPHSRLHIPGPHPQTQDPTSPPRTPSPMHQLPCRCILTQPHAPNPTPHAPDPRPRALQPHTLKPRPMTQIPTPTP